MNYGLQERAITVDMAWHGMAWRALIWQYAVYNGVYRCSRLLENVAKEIGYTALHDKPEKDAFLLGIHLCVWSLCSASSLDKVLCKSSTLARVESSGSKQQHSEHHFMAMKRVTLILIPKNRNFKL